MKRWIVIISIFILLIIGYAVASALVGIDEKKTAEERAVSIAMDKGGLKSVSDFYLYHGKEVYSVVVGEDAKGTTQVLWIPKKLDKNSTIVKKRYADGYSKNDILNIVKKEANPDEIISLTLGMENNKALWEVVLKDEKGQLSYYYYDFETGKERKITIKQF
ncbi:MAG: DUF5590 domain-containing protein [Bacillus sp. (in: firmicutes)]